VITVPEQRDRAVVTRAAPEEETGLVSSGDTHRARQFPVTDAQTHTDTLAIFKILHESVVKACWTKKVTKLTVFLEQILVIRRHGGFLYARATPARETLTPVFSGRPGERRQLNVFAFPERAR